VRTVRCAIYTRKSSDEGLEQGFNSLDAQREACAAYILSQASEGWTRIAGHYDDGGLSGGTLERPALQRLLADIAAGQIDIIVVYKVDRLTRSLLDFAKLVEAFDRAGVSFVSITQSFNTTTSMGRLTLNMLLSFAQFEREVTAERIRDKIAASKAKGMWMGGTPPLGYQPDGRTLSIVEGHAAIIRDIYARYLDLGNVRALEQVLIRDSIHAPQRVQTKSGQTIGGRPLSRGQLYKILNNRIYIGEIVHGEKVYAGLHSSIIDREVWEKVQALLAENLQGTRGRTQAAQPSLLAGRIVDEAGEPLVSSHACKGKVRYRYYVSQALHEATSEAGMRIPAREIEGVVTERLAALFDDPVEVIATAWVDVAADEYGALTLRARELAARFRQREYTLVRQLVKEVRVERGRITITCDAATIAGILGAVCIEGAPAVVALSCDVHLTRSGRALRLIENSGIPTLAEPNAALVRLIAQAHRLWGIMRSERIDVTRLAEREGMLSSYLTRVLRLAFLSPTVTEAILAGRQRSGVNVHMLTLTDGIVGDWNIQANAMLAEH
jgi:DNA invertase Pin-like site-specific DNA recombinase